MKSNEYIKLENTKTGEIFECKPNSEFVMPEGTYKSWNEARLIDEDGKTATIFKAGQIVENEKAKPKRKARVKEETVTDSFKEEPSTLGLLGD